METWTQSAESNEWWLCGHIFPLTNQDWKGLREAKCIFSPKLSINSSHQRPCWQEWVPAHPLWKTACTIPQARPRTARTTKHTEDTIAISTALNLTGKHHWRAWTRTHLDSGSITPTVRVLWISWKDLVYYSLGKNHVGQIETTTEAFLNTSIWEEGERHLGGKSISVDDGRVEHDCVFVFLFFFSHSLVQMLLLFAAEMSLSTFLNLEGLVTFIFSI